MQPIVENLSDNGGLTKDTARHGHWGIRRMGRQAANDRGRQIG